MIKWKDKAIADWNIKKEQAEPYLQNLNHRIQKEEKQFKKNLERKKNAKTTIKG